MIKVGIRDYAEEEIYKHHSDFDILKYYLNIEKIPCHINSPLRDDKGKDMSLYYNKLCNRICFKDFARGDSGTVFKLLSKMWNLTLQETRNKVYKEMSNFTTNKTYLAYQQGTRKYRKRSKNALNVKFRKWEDYDFKFWSDFGIDKTLLQKARIFPISYIFFGDKLVTADKYAYVFIEHKESKYSYKIYQPFSTKMKWLNNHDGSVISLWDMMPKKGDKLVICSSVKDALCLTAATEIPAIALQGEGYGISNSAVKQLKRRFKKIFICFDNDPPGIKYGKNLEMSTGFTNIVLPLDLFKSKDIADMYKYSINKIEVIETLKELFI